MSSVLRAVGTVIVSAVGIGLNFIPQVLGSCGLVGGSCVLILASAMTIYTTHLVQQTVRLSNSNKQPTNPSFKSLVRSHYSAAVANLTDFIVTITLIGLLALLLGMMGSRLESLSNRILPRPVLVAVAALVCSPLTWLQGLGKVGVVSMAGVILIFGFLAVVVTIAVSELAQTSTPPQISAFVPGEGLSALKHVVEYFSSFTKTFFSTFMVTAVPYILQGMARPEQFGRVNYLGNGAVLAIHFIIAVPCYLAYGSEVNRNIIDVISSSVRKKSQASQLAELLMLASCVPKYATLFAALASSEQFSSRPRRSALLLLTAVLAATTANLGIFVELLGSVSSVYLAVFVPVACFVKAKRLAQSPLDLYQASVLALVTLVGLLVSFCGVVGTVVSLV